MATFNVNIADNAKFKNQKVNLSKYIGADITLNFTGDYDENQIKTVEKDGNIVVTAYAYNKDKGEVDTKKVLGTYTFTNIEKYVTHYYNQIYYTTENGGPSSDLLFGYEYEATRKGNKVTGSLLAEYTESTSANETFNLGKTWGWAYPDRIEFDTTKGKLGSDTVYVNELEKLTLNFKTGSDADIYFEREKNDIVAKVMKGTEELAKVTFKGIDKLNRAELYNMTINNNGDEVTDQYEDVRNEEYLVEGSKKKFNGTYFSENAYSTSDNETFSLGTGDDAIIFGADENGAFDGNLKKFGTDIVNYKNYENLTLSFDADSSVEYNYNISNGKDVVIEALRTKNNSSDKETVGKVVLKNYLKIAEDCNGLFVKIGDADAKSVSEILLDSGITVYNSVRAVNKTGTVFDEIFYGSEGNDTYKAVAGLDTIYGGKGDDKLYAGKGADDFMFALGDASGAKGDTIYDIGMDDDIYIGKVVSGQISPDPGIEKCTFEKSGNDLVINHSDVAGASTVEDKITLSGYFKKDPMLFDYDFRINDVNITELSAVDSGVNISGKGKFSDTFLDDIITINGKSTITTGRGDDTIYLTYVQKDNDGVEHYNSTDDTVIIADGGYGMKMLKKISDDSEGGVGYKYDFGDKTVKVTYKYGAMINLELGVNNDNSDEGYICSKVGDDLIVEGYYNYQQDDEGEKYDSYGSYTIKDYFKSGSPAGMSTITVDGEDLDSVLYVDYIQITGNPKKANTLTDTDYRDYITGGNKADTINLLYGGSDVIDAGAGNDKINIGAEAVGTKLLNMSKGSGADTLNVDKTADVTVILSNDDVASGDAELSFEKKGNDLLAKTSYAADPDKKIKAVNDSVAVTDFFSKDSAVTGENLLFKTGVSEAKNFETLNDNGYYVLINGVKDTEKSTSKYGIIRPVEPAEMFKQNPEMDVYENYKSGAYRAVYNDKHEFTGWKKFNGKSATYGELVYDGTDYKDKMIYSGSGAANMFGGKNDDFYDVTLGSKADLYIFEDTEGGNNTIKINSAADDMKLFFNVDKADNVDKAGNVDNDMFIWNEVATKDPAGAYQRPMLPSTVTNMLFISNEADLTYDNFMSKKGRVQIDNYWGYNVYDQGMEYEVSRGAASYTIKDKNGADLDMGNYIDAVAGAVGSWLTETFKDKADIRSAFDVIQTGDKTLINEMLGVYANVDYSQINQE